MALCPGLGACGRSVSAEDQITGLITNAVDNTREAPCTRSFTLNFAEKAPQQKEKGTFSLVRESGEWKINATGTVGWAAETVCRAIARGAAVARRGSRPPPA